MDVREKILVLVRMRPLSEKEAAKNEVADWECINDTTILHRSSPKEHSGFETAYTYDRVFGGSSSTKEIYEEGAKEIALSVVKGINSTIFAYGQTSTGKTYTMTGITEYAVADIYDYVHRHEERSFILKFSALEIYNETVRDLLSSNGQPLRVLDDPEKGTIVVKLTEETLRDLNHLKQLLSACQALRRTEGTSMNETSSRSHQILRLTIESSAQESTGKDKSMKLSASLNFVDLAGSERASQAMSAGSRLKEGCHINRSLLTLGAVIRKLSEGKKGYINYRDSKLTRILQSSLGGSAQTAIICTLSPARSQVEQSRNTLLFASRAKEVSTNARVNVVLSEKSLIQQLQKQLARLETELATPAAIHTNQHYAALIKEKDLQIEKLEGDIQKVSRQRDLAESRVEDLLLAIENLQSSQKLDKHNKEWEDDDDDHSCRSAKPHVGYVKNLEYTSNGSSSSSCKVVRCAEPYDDDSSQEDNAATTSISPESPENASNSDKHVVQRITHGKFLHESSSARDPLMRDNNNGRSCRTFVSSLSTSCQEKMNQNGSHPIPTLEEKLSHIPEPFQRKLSHLHFDGCSSLLSSNSQSSTETDYVELLFENSRDWRVDGVPSLETSVKELQFEEQVDSQETCLYERAGRREWEANSDWRDKLEGLHKSVINLWQRCNVSLVHRTYFFLHYFNGDPMDSIYLKVELRRLAFLQQAYACSMASSEKDLRQERKMLSKLMQKRYTKEEMHMLFKKWSIGLDSKKRKLQLLNSIWTHTSDYHHIIQSAQIVARLINFSSDQHQSLPSSTRTDSHSSSK